VSFLTIISTVLVLGFTAGFAPGPTSTLVLTQTLRYGLREGAKVSLAPLFTDLPIMLIALFTMGKVSEYPQVFGAVSLVGGLFLLYLAGEVFFSAPPSLNVRTPPSGSLLKGITTNLLNPGPYLFWGTVGSPIMIDAFRTGIGAGIGVVVLFLSMIVGGKFSIAALAHFSSGFLRGSGYLWVLRCLGILMFAFAIFYFKDAGHRFGILL